METHVEKINSILDAISQDIAERERMADEAMHAIQKMKPATDSFKEANLQFGAHSYVANYLRHIKATVKDNEYMSLKRLEQCIRFHYYQQKAFGNLNDGRDISLAQVTIVAILGGYVERFFK